MLDYIVLKRTEYSDIYEFYPEGDTKDPGQIELFKDGTCNIVKKPNAYGSMYIGHAIHGINRKKDNGMVAWY